VLFAAFVIGPAQAATLRLDARTIYERAVSSNIILSPGGSALQLESGEVFQDDGPAAGYSYKPNRETLSPGIEIRKQLLIPDPRASKAVLMVGRGGDLKVEVNGNPQTLEAAQKTAFGEWQAYNINPAALKPGLNDIVVSGAGMVGIARADDSYVELPHRSARSTDGGKTWSVDRLGPGGDIAGEYYIRVYLEHFLSRGSILLTWWCCRATSRRTGSLFSLRRRNADQVHVPPTVPGDIGECVYRTILAHRNRVDEPGSLAVAEENRAVIGVLRGRNIVGYQVQILSRPCSRPCVHDYTPSIHYDATFRQVIQGVAVRPENEAEIAEMEIIEHAASPGRFRGNALQHIHALRPGIEPEQIAGAAVDRVDRLFGSVPDCLPPAVSHG